MRERERERERERGNNLNIQYHQAMLSKETEASFNPKRAREGEREGERERKASGIVEACNAKHDSLLQRRGNESERAKIALALSA